MLLSAEHMWDSGIRSDGGLKKIHLMEKKHKWTYSRQHGCFGNVITFRKQESNNNKTQGTIGNASEEHDNDSNMSQEANINQEKVTASSKNNVSLGRKKAEQRW